MNILFLSVLLALTGTPQHPFQVDEPALHPLQNSTQPVAGFGMRLHPVLEVEILHSGIDFIAAMRSPVYATATGVVLLSEYHEAYGQNIIVDHGDGYETRYAHLDERMVEVGEEVEAGQQIALTGNSGKSSAPHLHYEVIKDGESVDPMDYMPAK